MNTKTEQVRLEHELSMHDRSHSPLIFHHPVLSLTKQENDLMEGRLRFSISPELYQRIDTENLFNFNPEIRQPLSAGKFQSNAEMTIETSLKPDLLPHLSKSVAIDEIATHILELNQQQPDHPLFSTENWLALSITQQQASSETGYRTLWSYINPATLAQAATSGSHAELSEGVVHFFKDWIETNLSTTTQAATAQALDGISDFLKQFGDRDIDELLDRFPDDSTPDHSPQDTAANGTILETAIHFFTEDDWSFTKLQGHPVLQVMFQGENGKWNCYAQAREEQQQFLFYSICPVKVPKNKRRSMSEFLTRANYGLFMGNFELNFTDGEIRYKTSIDVQGDRLTPALIKRLVYTNVVMMDEYLPGIKAILKGEASIEAALQQVEG